MLFADPIMKLWRPGWILRVCRARIWGSLQTWQHPEKVKLSFPLGLMDTIAFLCPKKGKMQGGTELLMSYDNHIVFKQKMARGLGWQVGPPFPLCLSECTVW